MTWEMKTEKNMKISKIWLGKYKIDCNLNWYSDYFAGESSWSKSLNSCKEKLN